MQHTSCTEDRIQHALDRCLDGLRQMLMCSAGQSMNRWSLEELVKRDPENFLILLQQIIRKTKEVQEQCQYELVAPLAIMFSSTLLQTPYCPPDTELLEEAIEVFCSFLTWPEPYCGVCRKLLSTLQLEIKAPGKLVVFGADHVAGKVARAYNSLRRKESACPQLSRAFNLQFYFVPVKRDSAAAAGSGRRSSGPLVLNGSPKNSALSNVSGGIYTYNIMLCKLYVVALMKTTF
uniref:Phosphoinositide 3-kinase regulatory subunit 5 n=1 Tax=Stegastes partitus TaxID=144197 RepID=A0A3B5B5J3_9TELE